MSVAAVPNAAIVSTTSDPLASTVTPGDDAFIFLMINFFPSAH